jgi:hypothetical protein
MIKFSELKPGDYVVANYEGSSWEGVVTELNGEDKEVCVETEVQSFWFKPADLDPIPLTEAKLLTMGFEKEAPNDASSIKYKRGPFRVLLQKEGDFNEFEIWYREDHRIIHHPIAVHELQNHYLQMTKVELV